ncbi:hypothetical protein CBS147343_10116 [Aspergillus niger]|uniref:Altered inheritance of mitochondria protein 13, mitochondrial n=1 Tax=Aspergillus niger TaxID=5061 RepID=A0A9W6EBL7_ASPNG|nr:hypothetical protein CBS133816_1176 [Aspergillus niger]KAI2852785.1 hypothetical protein CBS11350_418 [Aspergillus niger]KAI2857345.1 hypothetical protein CBS12448_6570 [Aspergillus niger]KAI2914476.1 hypothetical protein CBS147371_6355 [Aspergillus niger]KAI2925442.1 hypothetical protein CBS147320_6305 [Aspergillus niger]
MGAGSSKPAAPADSKHVFSSSSPVQFSANFVDGLQSNTETDSARARSLELQIQERVAQELERLRAREQQTLAEIEKKLAEAKDTSSAPTYASAPSTASYYPPGSLNLDAPRIPFAGRENYYAAPPAAVEAAQQPINRELSRESVNSEIEELRAKLEGRKKLVEIDAGIEKARSDVVSCLRLNDRRPLDCWKEVEAFKKEVARLEEGFVDRIVG